MIFTFYKAQGLEVGKSLVEKDQIKNAKELLKNKKIILPIDVAIAKKPNSTLIRRTVSIFEIGKQYMGLDIGVKSIRLFEKYLKSAKTIVWNGPLGYVENKKYSKSSKKIMRIMLCKKTMVSNYRWGVGWLNAVAKETLKSYAINLGIISLKLIFSKN